MLRRRHLPQAQASRETEGRQKADESHRPRQHPPGSLHRSAQVKLERYRAFSHEVWRAFPRDCGIDAVADPPATFPFSIFHFPFGFHPQSLRRCRGHGVHLAEIGQFFPRGCPGRGGSHFRLSPKVRLWECQPSSRHRGIRFVAGGRTHTRIENELARSEPVKRNDRPGRFRLEDRPTCASAVRKRIPRLRATAGPRMP